MTSPVADAKGAVDVLNKLVSQDLRSPAGKPVVQDLSDLFCKCLGQRNVKSLLALGQAELIKTMAADALADGPSAVSGDQAQAALVETLLVTGKFDEALPAAKTYFNYCLLEHTQAAADFIVRKGRDGRMEVSRAPIPEMPGELKQIVEEMK